MVGLPLVRLPPGASMSRKGGGLTGVLPGPARSAAKEYTTGRERRQMLGLLGMGMRGWLVGPQQRFRIHERTAAWTPALAATYFSFAGSAALGQECVVHNSALIMASATNLP